MRVSKIYNNFEKNILDLLLKIKGAPLGICELDIDAKVPSYRIPAGAGNDAFVTIACPSGTNPVADNNADTLTLLAGAGITITGDAAADSITFTSTSSSSDSFKTINCPAGTDPIASSPTDTLNLAAGSGITITGDSATDTITFTATTAPAGGSNAQVQFNNGGVLAGSPFMTFSGSTLEIRRLQSGEHSILSYTPTSSELLIFYGGTSGYDNWGIYTYYNALIYFTNSANINTFKIWNQGSGTVNMTLDGQMAIGTTNLYGQATIEGVVALRETTAPAGTASYGKIYVKSSDSLLYFKTDGGVEYLLTGSGSGNHNLLSLTHPDTTTGTVEAGDLIRGYGSPAKWTRLPKGTNGQVLTLVSGYPEWVAAGSTAHNLLSATHTDTLTNSAVAGDMLYANATPKWTRLPKGTEGYVLKIVGGYPSWAAESGGSGSKWTDAGSYLYPTNNEDIYIQGSNNFTLQPGYITSMLNYTASAIYRTNTQSNVSVTTGYIECKDTDTTNYTGGTVRISNGLTVAVHGWNGSAFPSQYKDFHGILTVARARTDWTARGTSGIIAQAWQYGTGVASNEFYTYNDTSAFGQPSTMISVLAGIILNKTASSDSYPYDCIMGYNHGTYKARAVLVGSQLSANPAFMYGVYLSPANIENGYAIYINSSHKVCWHGAPVTYLYRSGNDIYWWNGSTGVKLN